MEVVRRDGFLEVWIVCVNWLSFLVDVMEVVEFRGLVVMYVRIVCYNDIVFEYLRFEVRIWLCIISVVIGNVSLMKGIILKLVNSSCISFLCYILKWLKWWN